MSKHIDTLRQLIIIILAKEQGGISLGKIVTTVEAERAVERQTVHGIISRMVKEQQILRLEDIRCCECNHLVSVYTLSRRMRSELALNGRAA